MFGIAKLTKRKTAANVEKVYSIAAMMRGRNFAGSFEAADVTHRFTFSPAKAALVGRRLQLTGSLTVFDGRPNARTASRALANVRATLVSAQGGIGTAPPRNKLPTDILHGGPDLPVIESTGALSFCGALFFKLSSLEGRALGVSADLSSLQLNVRLAPTNDHERAFQAAYSSIVDAIFGTPMNSASEQVSELNRLLVPG